MRHPRGDLGERDQHKRSLVHAGMRQRQLTRVENHVIDQEQIEIERAGCAGERPRAAKVALDVEQGREEIAGSQRGIERDDRIQEPRLLYVSDRLSLVETLVRYDRSKLGLSSHSRMNRIYLVT